MSRRVEPGDERPRSARVRATLPVIAVHGREDLAVLLARHGRLMREYARHYLGKEATADEVEEVVELTVDALLAAEVHATPHGLRVATLQLWRECQRAVQLRERRRFPVDRRLGPLTGRVARVLEQLGPRSRQTILRAAEGWTPEEQARADNTSIGTIHIRLHRARNRAEQLLREGGHGAFAFLLVAPHRFRDRLHRELQSLGNGATVHALAAAVLVPLVASSFLWGATTPAAPHPVTPVVVAEAHGPASIDVAIKQPAVTVSGSPPSPGSVIASASPKARPAGVRIARRSAAEETPDDVKLTTVATPADGRPVVVAGGYGNGCSCWVLMQSLDGGDTWAATNGIPVAMGGLVIPPAYPRDPRIFLGNAPLLNVAPAMSEGFGKPFTPITGLPAGQVAVSAHFDDGDPRLFSAGDTAVWSIRIGGPTAAVPHDEIDYAPAAVLGDTAALATPAPSPAGPAILAWAPSRSLATVRTNGSEWESRVMRCPVAGPCTSLSTLPTIPSDLSTDGTNVVVAHSPDGGYVSRDGGTSFAKVVLPADTGVVVSVIAVGADGSLWASVARWTSTDVHVVRMTPAGWIDAGGSSDRHTPSGTLFAVGNSRIMELFSGLGYRCTLTSGGPWMPRCPAV